ncbi:hypothetical protein LIER_28697 [Lithospermum erythrorhizon]|uniref:Dilute domain-containing protein n=1 Tax=Lithospermum erythrorhizon TaxID=34254 RepID=A0AAV3RKW4_LITER
MGHCGCCEGGIDGSLEGFDGFQRGQGRGLIDCLHLNHPRDQIGYGLDYSLGCGQDNWLKLLQQCDDRENLVSYIIVCWRANRFLKRWIVLEHTAPLFLPLCEVENELLSTNAMKFIDHVGDLLQAYVDRRKQVRLIKELYGNQIKELYHSLPYQMVEFVLDDFDCKEPSWLHDLINDKGTDPLGSHCIPIRLLYAEDALRTMSLPQAYAEIVLNLPQAFQDSMYDEIVPFPHGTTS